MGYHAGKPIESVVYYLIYGLCHEDIAVLEQFRAEGLTWCLYMLKYTQNALVEL